MNILSFDRLGWTPMFMFAEIFMVVAIPGVIAAIALVIKQLVHPEQRIAGFASVAETLAH